MTTFTQVSSSFTQLQQEIMKELSGIENRFANNGQKHFFQEDKWIRPNNEGGGVSYVIEGGDVFERGGVMFSHISGDKLPASATVKRPHLVGAKFDVCGVSIVLHPRNPHVPTVHMNVRFFMATTLTNENIWWFGGGMDLTPYYAYEADAQYFHQTCKNALDSFGGHFYPQFKLNCDQYFCLKHRQEQRGIGGIFFDDFDELTLEESLAMTLNIGDHFILAYRPILENRVNVPYDEQQRAFQAYRRGRYVEFNLIYDRGTLFGLHSNGRTEAILVSMPPQATWKYHWQAKPGSPEEKLTQYFLKPQNWLD